MGGEKTVLAATFACILNCWSKHTINFEKNNKLKDESTSICPKSRACWPWEVDALLRVSRLWSSPLGSSRLISMISGHEHDKARQGRPDRCRGTRDSLQNFESLILSDPRKLPSGNFIGRFGWFFVSNCFEQLLDGLGKKRQHGQILLGFWFGFGFGDSNSRWELKSFTVIERARVRVRMTNAQFELRI